MEETESKVLPSDTRAFLGMGNGENYSTQPRTGFGRIGGTVVDTDAFDERTARERRARAQVSAQMLFGTDVSKLDDVGASALYQSVTEGLFGLPDEDGSVAFGKRASKDPRANIDMLRRFVKGEYSLIEDPEYTKWREMDDDAKFKYALEHETTGNMAKSKLKGERGTNPLVAMAAGDMSSYAIPWTEEQRQGQEIDRKRRGDAIRNSFYDSMDEDKKAAYRADVVADYDKKLSRRQTLATFLSFSQGLSDRASHLLAKSFADGTPDSDIETLPEDERDRVYSAFSLMRGDQKSGTLLFVPADFTDDTAPNRVQMGLYGLQQSVLGLATDTWGMAKDAALWSYAKTALSESERADFFKWWDAQARMEQAMKQELPDAQGFVGEAFQGVMENLHWFIPYSMIGKGGKMATAARGIKGEQGILKGLATTLIRPMKLGGTLKEEKATLEAGKAAMEAGAAATKAAWTLDVNGVKKLGDMGGAILARQMAAVERYTQMLHGIDNDLKAAKWWKDAAGTGMWMAGEASAFSAFASEYIANADAAGISREESVLTAAAIGLINAKIEQLYVPGLESSLSPAQIKSLTFAAMAQAMRSDGAAGFRKWLANRVSHGVREGVKVAASEGVVEEPLQQMAIEHGKAFDKLCQELRKNGQATPANEAKALWDSFAATLPQDYATFIDTAADMLPSSVGFGVTTIGNMTRRQHIHNVVTRHANRRAGAKAADTMFNLAQKDEDPSRAFDYDAGIVDYLQRAIDVRNAVEKHWRGEGGEAQKNPRRFEEAITAARQAFRNPQTGDVVREVAQAAGVDVKTAEVLTQYLQTETEAAAFSPTVRAWTSLNMSLADIDEETIKTVLPGYVEGSFASDPDAGVYSGKVKLADGTERTIAYKVGDFSDELRAEADENAKIGSAFGDSFNARHEELGDGIRWETLSDAQRYQEALFASNAAQMGSGVFELTDAKGEKVRVNADSVIRLANGHIADIGYGPAATQATVRHETFHALWRFIRASLADADVQQLAKTLGIDVTADKWERKLDEKMAHQVERYASGHYVSHAVSSRFDKTIDGWAGRLVNFFAQFGQRDEVTDPQTGKPYALKDIYDKILRGELGTGALGVELSRLPAQPTGEAAATKSAMPVEVTDADRTAQEAEMRQGVDETSVGNEKLVQQNTAQNQAKNASVDENGIAGAKLAQSSVPVATAESPADASTPNQRYYRVGLPNSNVKLVGRLEVRDVETGLVTSTDSNYHDRGNQNRDDRSEESRALVEKIGANPDPLQIGTVQPIASNGVVWMLPNGDVIIGNHRVNGVRRGYAKGTAENLEKFVREDAAKRGLEIGEGVKKPLLVFVLERIESPDGKADVHEVVRLANESQNRGFNVREQAGNDAKILLDNNLLPRMAFRADGRIDETKSGEAIGKFRQETGAQGMIAEDGSLAEEGQTRIQNAALAVLLGGEGTGALLQKIMSNAGRLDMQNELRALMKMTPELMDLSEDKSAYDLRAPLAEALQLFTEWRDKDESARVEKGKTRHDWRETAKDGHRLRGVSWEQFMAQGDMFRAPTDEAKILGDLFARAEAERSFDREDVESAVGKKRAIDLITGYLTDYIENVRAVNTETEDMFGAAPATRAEVMAAQRATGGENGAARFSIDTSHLSEAEKQNLHAAQTEAQRVLDQIGGTELGNSINRDFHGEARTTLIGKTIRTAKDLAALAQVYRNPCFETFRYIFTKNGEVVWQTGVTARLPGSTDVSVDTPNGGTYGEIERMARKLKPDGVWLLHNHPSGSVAPSQADINATNMLRNYFERQNIQLDGHVIIDHDTYAELDKWGNYSPKRIDAKALEASYHGKPYDNPSKGSEAISSPLREPGRNFGLSDIVSFFMRLQRDATERGKVLTFITVDTKANSVMSVASVPMAELVSGKESLSQTLADYRGATGGHFLFVIGNQAIEDYGRDADAVLRRQMEIGNVTDFLWSDATGRDWMSVRSSEIFTLDRKGMKRLEKSRLGRVDLGEARYSISGVYTGSAADYEKPSLHYVGTGEGSQVYGWGLYASDRRGVAEGYANSDAKRRASTPDEMWPKYKGKFDSELEHDPVRTFALKYVAREGSVDAAIQFLRTDDWTERATPKAREAAEWLEKNRDDVTPPQTPSEHLYEQTWFTDRAPGDESHLLKWYEPVSEEQGEWILDALKDMGSNESLLDFVNGERKKDIERDGLTWRDVEGEDAAPDYYPDDVLRDYLEQYLDLAATGGEVYGQLSEALGSPKAASEFLARAGIDGVKYPVDSYGKAVKDGDEAGWNYVSFRDDNIRVDHKWTDGQMRYSISKDLQDAMRKREILEGIPAEGRVQPWPENFPKVMLQTTLASIKKKWLDLHTRAKAGSDGAAIELVRDILGEERVGKRPNPKWGKLRALAAEHPRAIIVPVRAQERTGRNKIPSAYALMIEKIAGLRVTPNIVQTVRANHTGANAVERMMRRAAFAGAVSRGREYILVDDHVTQGGTLNELRKYIQSKGGKVVAVTTLTASQFSDTLSISADVIEALYKKFGNNLDEELKQAGIANGVAELTQSQARELRKLRVDTFRDRIAAARVQRQRELDAQAARLAGRSDSVSGRTDLLPGLKDYFKPDGTSTETGTRWAKARQFQRAIGRELNSIIDEALLAEDLTPEETASLLDRLITSAEATDEIRNGVLPNFRSDSSTDDPSVTLVGPDGRRQFTPERKAIQQQVYDKLMNDTISGENNEALETRADGTAKEDALIVAANEGPPDLPPISLRNPTYETQKDFRIDIIVGPPAAGKSSVFANALSVWYRSRVLDCDACKKGLPGFNDGNGANYVHAESSRLNKRMIYDIQHRAEDDPRRGENVVLPVLGDDVEGLRRKIAEWHAVGYTVYLHNNRVPILHAFGRALLRTLATGRWINPLVIHACQDNPTRAYNEVKKEADYYDQFSNDVPLGEKPFWEDGNYLDPAYGDVRRLDGQGLERGEADGTGADGRLGRPGLVGRSTAVDGQYILPGLEDQVLFSTEAPRFAYPNPLNALSDDELISAAVATRMALGNSEKLSDRAVKMNTVQNLMRRLHPEYTTADIGLETLRVISDARKLGKRIREDLDRGVSESLILEHLPDAAREQFGREMRQEARKGQRLGVFAQRVKGEIDERQARIIEDAVRVQTGIDADNIENAYGINLSETIMRLAENPLTAESDDAAKHVADTGAGEAEEQAAAPEEQPAEIDAKVKAVVDDILSASRTAAETDEQNRKNRKAAAGRDAENENAMGESSEDGAEDSVPDDSSSGDGDFLAAAVAKEGLNLESPRHLARFVAELARRQWIKEHGLGQNAEVWNDLVAVQFLRKTAQSVYAKLCRDLTYSRSRETAMSHISKLDAAATVAGLMSEMEFVGALINAQRIRDTQKQKCEKLDLFLRERFGAQGRFKPDKEEGKRKVSAEAELRARYMRHAMWLTPDAAAEEARQLQETLDALSVDFKDAGRDRDQSREFVETIRKLNVLREFGALRYKPLGEIDTAAQWWEAFERGSAEDIVREMSDRDIRTKKAAHLLAVAFADPKRTTIREGGKADALNRFITGHMGFVSLLQDCMRHASDADAAAVKDIIDYISREIQKAGDRSEAEKRRHNDAFHAAVEGIYGKRFNAVMKGMMAPDERFTEFMGVVGGKRVTPTKGRALQLLVSLLQEGRKVQVEDEDNPGQTRTEWIGGYHDNIVKHKREGQAQKIMRLLTPADMNMLKWLGQWYEQNRSELSGVCNSLFGIGVYAELPNYFPVKMMLEKQGLEKGEAVGWTIFPKALTPRVRNERDFDTSADIFSMWASRMEEAAQWKHHAKLGLEMRGIFGRGELQASVIANHGASVNSLMQGFITDILSGHGAYDRSTAGVQYFSDQIRGWTALCALGGNVGVTFKQTTSIPAFGFEIGLVNTAKYMVTCLTPDGFKAMLKIWDSEQRKTRWQKGSSEAVRNALLQQNAGWLKRALQASMITNKLGDVVPALVVGQGIYRDCLARGMSAEDAMAETWSLVERTQQSGRMENQIQVQRRNKLGRIMFQFLSTQQQYLQYEVRAVREVIANPHSVKRWGSLGRAILLNHFILTSAYFWMGELYKAWLGQEPPEDQLKDWVISCLLGPYASLMVAGFMCKATLERALKGYTWRSPSMLPMEEWLKNQVNDGAKLLEAIFDSDGDTWDNMLDAAGRWMSDSNSTVRDLRKIYRYRVKGEQQK